MSVALAGAVLTASLLGSTHCAGMCGAFAAFAASPDRAGSGTREKPFSRSALNAAYNAGRLATYLTFGFVAGSLGAAFDLGGSLLGVERVVSLAVAGLMIGVGAIALLKHFGVKVRRAPIPQFVHRLAYAGHVRAFSLRALPRAFAIGLLTTFLPCGWLYTFVLVSASTASPLGGAVMMAIFWIGTLPMMAAVGLGAQVLTGSMRRHLPLATNLALIGTAVWMFVARIQAPIVPGNLVSIDWRNPEAAVRARSADETCPLCSGPGKAAPHP